MPLDSARPGGDSTALPLRVALFTGNYNHIADGVSLTLNRLVAFLLRQGVEVLVFGPTVADPPVEHAGDLVPIPSLPAPGRPEYRISVRFPQAAQDRLKRFDPHLVHIATPDYLGYRALRWAQQRDLPVVTSYHTHFASYLKYYGISALEGVLWEYLRWFYRQCEQVYVPSHAMAAVLRSHEITHGIRLWERGVETDRFHPGHRDPAWRCALGVEPDDVLVAFVGRLVWEKGLAVYADVIEALRADGLPARSVVVGDGPARPDLEARLTGTVFTGHLSGADLARAYASSDVFLFPSDTETFGNVTLEAMSSGL
ncbi:MAG: glycosyltransferase family 1 protein, partial [Rhodothermales bacterium]|nr:glycosyltransferase family 1 protein [Rhodothermales bacterium]